MRRSDGTPTPPPGTDPRERLAWHLLRTHRGWDRPPVLGIVYAVRTGLAALPIPIADDLWADAHPAAIVRAAGHAVVVDPAGVDDNPPHLRVIAPRIGRYAGCWLVIEGWRAPPDHAAEVERRLAAGGSVPPFADQPGAVEVKQVILTGLDSTVFVLRHDRGGDTSTGHEACGTIADALRETTRRLAEQLNR